MLVCKPSLLYNEELQCIEHYAQLISHEAYLWREKVFLNLVKGGSRNGIAEEGAHQVYYHFIIIPKYYESLLIIYIIILQYCNL